MSNLEIQIKERQEKGNALFYPAKILALKKGIRRGKKHGAIMYYHNSKFTIHYDTFAPNLTVYDSNDNQVLNFHLGDIIKYISGEWEICLKALALPVIREEERNKRSEEEEKERKRLADWGLVNE